MEYDSSRITGKTADIANSCIQAIGKMLALASATMAENGEKVSLLAGGAIPPLSGLACMFAKDQSKCLHPTTEEVTFGALYVIACTENHEQGLIAGYNINTLAKALQMFKDLTGRDYENIDPYLLNQIQRAKDKAGDVPDHLKKFVS